MKFDELNILDDYFEPMAISADDKKRRRELANLLTDAFLYFFSVVEVHRSHKSQLEKALYEQLLSDKVSDAVSKVTGIDSEISNHIRTLSKEVVNTTFNHIDLKPQVGQRLTPTPTITNAKSNTDNDFFSALIYDSEESLDSPLENVSSDSHFAEEDALISEEADEVEDVMGDEAKSEYWLSINRAISIANNEANTIFNYTSYVDAKDLGRTQKTWLTMLDKKVRDTHEELEGQTIGIDDYFQVGNSQMLFPLDWSMSPNPRETINCRCAVEYK